MKIYVVMALSSAAHALRHAEMIARENGEEALAKRLGEMATRVSRLRGMSADLWSTLKKDAGSDARRES